MREQPKETLGVGDASEIDDAGGSFMWSTFTGSPKEDTGCTNADGEQNIAKPRDVLHLH